MINSAHNTNAHTLSLYKFTGNIIPVTWLTSQKLDLISIFLLSELLFKYKQYLKIKTQDLSITGLVDESFFERCFKSSYSQLSEKFNLSKLRLRSSIDKLSDYGLITKSIIAKKENGSFCGQDLYLIPEIENINKFFGSDCLNAKGNIVPHNWYNRIIDLKGQADLQVIALLSEITYWYRAYESEDNITKEKILVSKIGYESWKTNYDYLLSKTSFSKKTLQRILKRLEDLNLANRIFKINESCGIKNYHLSIGLNITKLLEISNLNQQTPTLLSSVSKSVHPPRQIQSHNIELNNSKNKEIDLGLNEKFKEGIKNNNHLTNFSLLKGRNFKNKKKINNFLPITDLECDQIRGNAGKEFSNNAINKLLSHIARKYPDKEFWSRRIFISYASKIIANEIRTSNCLNNIDFSFRTKQEVTQEAILYEIEHSRDDSLDTKIKKQIIPLFEPEIASKIVENFYFPKLNKGVVSETRGDSKIEAMTEEMEVMLEAIENDGGDVNKCEIRLASEYSGQHKPLVYRVLISPEFYENYIAEISDPNLEKLKSTIFKTIYYHCNLNKEVDVVFSQKYNNKTNNKQEQVYASQLRSTRSFFPIRQDLLDKINQLSNNNYSSTTLESILFYSDDWGFKTMNMVFKGEEDFVSYFGKALYPRFRDVAV